MKNNIVYIIFFGALFLSSVSCNKLDDIEPVFLSDANETIINIGSADLALTAIYARFRSSSEFYVIPSAFSNLGFVDPGGSAEYRSYGENNPSTAINDIADNADSYRNLYDIINNANFLIRELEPLEVSTDEEARKAEILAEARSCRALANFYLLRLWGQFYDMNSEFGINIRTAPAESNQAFPRNTVAETYAQIIADLDDGIANGPEEVPKFFISKTAAKGLKAKVLLYMGNYAEAASLAQDVIENSSDSFGLAPTHAELFDNTSETIVDNVELLFVTRGETTTNTSVGLQGLFRNFVQGNPDFFNLAVSGSMTVDGQVINYDFDGSGSRMENTFSTTPPDALLPAKYISEFDEILDAIYHLRMAEVYLIHAEAAARSGNTVTSEALASLNAVRTRAGATTTGADGFETYPATISLDQFLEAVRIEKSIELAQEIGEEWFDLVRYDHADGFGSGFQVSGIKASATDPDKFILPISPENIENGGGVIQQNPGY